MKVFICLYLLVIVFAKSVAANEESNTALIDLRKQITLIERIHPYVERMDLSRFLMMKESTQKTIDLLVQYNMGHSEVFHQYQYQIVTYRYSNDFLDNIKTDETVDELDQLKGIAQKIAVDRGFDQSPWTRITSSIFSQIYGIVNQLIDSTSSVELKKELIKLKPQLGHLQSAANLGDRPLAFKAGIKMYHSLRALYPKLNDISYASDVFDLVLELRGRNEFYGDYAQVKLLELDK